MEGTERRGCTRLVKSKEISAEFKFHGLKSKCFEKYVAHKKSLLTPFHSLLLGLAHSRFHTKAKRILLHVWVLTFQHSDSTSWKEVMLASFTWKPRQPRLKFCHFKTPFHISKNLQEAD